MKTVSIGLTIGLLMACLPGIVSGEENALQLSISAREEYSDNLFYSKSKKESDLVTTVSPKLQWAIVTEKANASVSAGVDRIMYHENDELDQTDQAYAVGVGYNANERFSFSPKVSYIRDSHRERDLDTTGLLQNDIVRERWQSGLSGNYLLSEKESIGFSAMFDREDFEGIGTSDSDSWNGSLVYSRFLDPAIRWSLQFGYAAYDYDLSNVDNCWVSTGVNWKMNESISMEMQLGGRFTRSKYEETRFVIISPFVYPVLREVEAESSGLIGSLALNYQGENSTLGFSMNHDVANASGRSGTTNRTAFVLSANRQLTENWFFYFTCGYYFNQADAGELGTEDIDERTVRLQPLIRYRINRYLSLDWAYRYAQIEDREDNSTVRNSAITMQIGYHYDLLQ